MDRCPVEIWNRIFTLACTDSGFTGRSLSLTSQYIHELSKPVKLQSLLVTNSRQILGLARLLADTPPQYRRVRYLFIGDSAGRHWVEFEDVSPTFFSSHARAEVSRLYEKPTLDAYQYIIRATAPTLLNLDVQFQFYVTHLSFPGGVSYPSLVELALYSFPIYDRGPSTPVTEGDVTGSSSPPHHPPLFPSLRRLYLEDDWYDLRCITSVAPQLTHLSLPYHFPLGEHLSRGRTSYTHYPGDDSSSSSSDVISSCLPSTLKMFLIDRDCDRSTPAPEMRMICNRDVENVEAIAKKDERVYLLHDKRPRVRGIKDAERYWLDRMEGGDGLWAVPGP